MRATARKVLIIQGHPDPQGHHSGHAPADAYAKGAGQAGHQVQHIAIASLDFPLLRSREDLQHGTPPDAIRHAQSAILDADHIVLIYPVWNGGLPALVKGFLEQTFRPTFTFPNARRDERLGFFAALRQRKALPGKTARVVATMMMPALVYRCYFHPHLEKNTLRLASIRSIKESLIGSVEASDGHAREHWRHQRARSRGVVGPDLALAWNLPYQRVGARP